MKFSGDFKELKPMGWTFHKLYARNYKAYMLEDFIIWVSQREFMYRHFNGPIFEKLVQMIITDNYPLYDKVVMLGEMPLMNVGDPKSCIIDKQDMSILPRDEHLGLWKKEFPDYHDYFEFYYSSQRFEELIIHKRHIKIIKNMNERNMLCLNP